MSSVSGDRQYIAIPIVAVNDFSNVDKIGRAVTRGGEFADTGLEAIGICMQNVESGQTMQVGVSGLMKFRPIDVCSAGSKLTVITSGWFQVAAADTYTSGVCLGASSNDDANVNSGALGTGHFNFAIHEFLDALSGGLVAV